jgi:predicted translin family RNA/ssDNA-binding protein
VVVLMYDTWNEIIHGVIELHAPFLEAMKIAAKALNISSEIVKELKRVGFKEIREKYWSFHLEIESYDDEIGGFKVFLSAAEACDEFQEAISNAANAHGVSLNDLKTFEIEHGLDLIEDIFEVIEENYNIYAQETNEGVLFALVVFDSDDIDNSGLAAEDW